MKGIEVVTMRIRLGNTAWTVRSTIFVVVILLATLLLFDGYKWRRFTLPWSSSASLGAFNSANIAPPNTINSTKKGQDPSGVPGVKEPADKYITNETLRSTTSVHNTSVNSSHPVMTTANVTAPTTSAPLALTASTSPSNVKIPGAPLTSFQKLEAGLRQARLYIRKVFALGSKEVQVSIRGSDDEPHGDVYINAATFRQSYLEMEKRFKIFVYAEGEEPLVHNGPCKEIYAIEGRFIQELQGENPFLTTDPEQAHVFFMPFSVAMMVTYLYDAGSHDIDPLQDFTKDYIDVIADKYHYWNRSSGADHFMLSCHDWGPAVTKSNHQLETNAIRVLCNANSSEGYVPYKDVSLPEINLQGGHIPAALGGPPVENRPHLAFFAGGEHGPVRSQLFKYWEGKDQDVIVYKQLPKELNYQELMKNSRFCLCPGGYEVNSPRIVEAIYNDCVPVIIADAFVLPFSDVLNWSAFSVRVKECDIPNLKEILQAIPMDRCVAMQEKVKQVQRHFLLNQPTKRYDAFHMILHSVWLRRINIRLH